MKKTILSSFMLAAVALTAGAQTNLQTDHLDSPLGVDNAAPRLSWTPTQDSDRLTVQVLDEQGGVLWKETTSDAAVCYAGPALQPLTRYRWQLLRQGNKVAEAAFTTGKQGERNWHGSWIGDGIDRDKREAPYFRKTFNTSKPVKQALACISAGGLFRLSVNGEAATDNFLEPVYTRFDRRTMYCTYDVTRLLREGRNCLGVVLGNGWYNHQAIGVWDFEKAPWRQRPCFILDLHLTYADGTSEVVSTDLSWRTASGALIYNNVYTGEHVDFRRDLAGWDTPEYNEHQWHGVRYRQAPAPQITSQQMRPIRLIERYKAQRINKLSDTHYVLDFGSNFAGITEVHLQGEAGTRVEVRHGERLHADGSLDPSNIDVYYRGDREKEPFQTDVYMLSGNLDTYRPQFSYKGFRYAEVRSDRPITLNDSSIVAYFTHSDVPVVGSISSASPLLDKVVAATCRAYISNLMGYPTDCPQREKNGWTGDGHLAIETALFNYDGFTVYDKWMRDHRDEQQPNGVLPDIIPTCGWGYGTDNGLDWTSTIVIIPWQLYLFTGDDRPLRQCYDNMCRYVDYVSRIAHDNLTTWGRGDWVPVKTHSNKEYTSTVYYFADACIVTKAAKLLGHYADAERYTKLAADIRQSLNGKYLNREQATYAGGSQTEQSMALYWGVVPDELRQAVADNLAQRVREADCHIDCGVLGAKCLLQALSDNGYADLAYAVATQDTYPSWGNWIVNGHATTLLENWDLNATRDISDNHIMFGEIGAWPYKALAGFRTDEAAPGFRHTILQPVFPAALFHFQASHTTPYGPLSIAWQQKGKRVRCHVVVPCGTTATFIAPQGFTLKGNNELRAGEHDLELTRMKK